MSLSILLCAAVGSIALSISGLVVPPPQAVRPAIKQASIILRARVSLVDASCLFIILT